MKKLFFYSFLIISALSSCSKDEEPTPAPNVEGKWNLATMNTKIKAVTGDSSDDTIDYKNDNVYIDLKAGNKFSGNIVMADDAADLITLGNVYESDYEINGNTLTLKIYDNSFEEYIPVKLKVESATDTQMILKVSKTELTEVAKIYDQLEGTTMYSQMLLFITSLDATLTFTK